MSSAQTVEEINSLVTERAALRERVESLEAQVRGMRSVFSAQEAMLKGQDQERDRLRGALALAEPILAHIAIIGWEPPNVSEHMPSEFLAYADTRVALAAEHQEAKP